MKSQLRRIGTVLGLPPEIYDHPGVLQLVKAVVDERQKPLSGAQLISTYQGLCADHPGFSIVMCARAIEAAHGIKSPELAAKSQELGGKP